MLESNCHSEGENYRNTMVVEEEGMVSMGGST